MDSDLVLELPNDLRAIEHAVDYVCRCCRTREGAHLGLNFRVGLTEALSNAMLYGNARDPQKRVRIEVCMDSGRVTACITDEGEGFDPEAVPDPTAPSNLTRPCGRGLFLMRQLLDEVRYNDKGNSVTLVLRVGERVDDQLGGGARA